MEKHTQQNYIFFFVKNSKLFQERAIYDTLLVLKTSNHRRQQSTGRVETADIGESFQTNTA